MIEFKNVTKVYDTGTEAVHNATFTIDKGEFAFLVGPSGSGKSTLIKLILKEEEANRGNIIINGKDITFLKTKRVHIYVGAWESFFKILDNFQTKQ